MSAALDRHRARAAEILGAPAQSTIKVETTRAPATSKGTVTVEDNQTYYGPSVNPTTGEYSPPYVPPAPAPVYEGPSINRSTGAYAPPKNDAKTQRAIQDAAQAGLDAINKLSSPSSSTYTSPLEIRPWYPNPYAAQPATSSVFTAKNVAIGLGALAGLGLIAVLARRR